ncbi:nucleoid-associated protein [Thiopseudomonas denitrificans]|uniref:Nucleoid associated protein NdpA n=1 Tax=Thiopseudomonas denitrificans TaxID=1501432 RepID=A0A4V3D568_9GAMM|nr:nucleoid-associated protein [Thiopseudomonas denitrificans]TDQ38957.1 nucleoid associated protein NdpA [Thiopseudomonas denitrificans]
MKSIEIGETVVENVILHQIGNRLREEPLILAVQCFDITESIANLILGGYLRGIVSDKNQYMLTHESDMVLNDVAHHVSSFFSRKISFIELSRNLAAHLYASAHHPNIASGDLFVILFDKLKLDGKYKSAIGVYKAESKQQYISTRANGENRQLEVSSGINPDLIDKGVLIVEDSEIVYAIDRLSSRTKYWIEDFLKAKQVPNENTKTAVAAGLIEKVRDNIESPVARQDFCREVIALCEDRDEVPSDEIRTVSEKYVSPEIWGTELARITERKGLVDTGEINVPTRNLQTKLKKMFNRINLGQDIGLILPDNLSFNNANFTDDEETIQISITLEKKNG